MRDRASPLFAQFPLLDKTVDAVTFQLCNCSFRYFLPSYTRFCKGFQGDRWYACSSKYALHLVSV